MAVTLVGSPQQYHPGFNPNFYYFDSTNKNATGFKYIVEIFYAGTSTLINSFEIAPRPVDGYGEINIEESVNKLVSFNEPLFSNAIINNNSNGLKFDIKVKEKTAQTWTYLDYEFNPSGTWEAYTIVTTNPSSGPTSPDTHSYIVGDQIVINQVDGGALKPALQGLHTVVEVIDNRTIVIDVPWWQVGSGAAVSGVTRYADGRLTTSAVLLTVSNKFIFNAAFNKKDFISYDEDDYKTDSGTDKLFLTDYPETGIRMKDNQNFWVNFLHDSANIGTMEMTSDDGTVITFGAALASTVFLAKAQVGPANLTGALQAGTLPLIKPDTKWYTFRLIDNDDNAITKSYKVFIDRECPIHDIQLEFIDKKGSLCSFYFPFKYKINNNIERKNYKKLIGDLNVSNSKYEYTTIENDNKVYNVEGTKTMTLTSDYLTQIEANYFEQLISSHTVYLKLGDTINDYYYTRILTSSYETFSNKDKVRQYTIEITLDDMISNI